jgi:hypothetical protein
VSHLSNNNETYFSHLKFAGVVGLTLVARGVIFIFHALVPFFPISTRWNLEATAEKLQKWNTYTKERMKK